ncbi:MAG: hypothetical protein WCG80_03970 [Spirochaetales bacterium]
MGAGSGGTDLGCSSLTKFYQVPRAKASGQLVGLLRYSGLGKVFSLDGKVSQR